MNLRLVLLSVLGIATLSACGGGGNTADAPPLIHETDAGPPDAGVPDAFVCNLTTCGTECVDTTSDPLHCMTCDNACQSGASCVSSNCVCPPAFIPDSLTTNLMDMVLTQLPGAYVAVKPYFGNEIDALAVAYPTTGILLNHNYVLDGSTLPATPFVAAAYDIDTGTFMPKAAFAANSGTLRFTSACDVGATGRLTNATFVAVTSFLNPMIDPNGCSFDVASVNFTIGTACP